MLNNHILNLKGVEKNLKGNYGLNIYHRISNAMNGNFRGMTVEMISEIEGIIKQKDKEMLDYLKKMKEDVKKFTSENKKAA